MDEDLDVFDVPLLPEATPQATAPGRPRTFQSLRHRNFRLFFIGQLISNSGNWLTAVTMVLLVLHRTNSGLAVGLITACQFGPILILSAWAGLIADRSNKRHLLIVTQTLEMLESCTEDHVSLRHETSSVVSIVSRVHAGAPSHAD